jgi:hypothetical protein
MADAVVDGLEIAQVQEQQGDLWLLRLVRCKACSTRSRSRVRPASRVSGSWRQLAKLVFKQPAFGHITAETAQAAHRGSAVRLVATVSILRQRPSLWQPPDPLALSVPGALLSASSRVLRERSSGWIRSSNEVACRLSGS